MSFVSIMKRVGHDIDWLFHSKPFVIGEQVAQAAIGVLLPGSSQLVNMIINLALTTESNFANAGQAQGTGVQKLAAVMGVAGNLIQQAMKDLGIQNVTAQKAEELVSAVVTLLNNTAANPAPSTPPTTP